MMVPKFKKKHLFIIVSIITILVGLAIFLLAYGLSSGWPAVAAWFGSKYAILLYMLIGMYLLVVLWIVVSDKVKKL